MHVIVPLAGPDFERADGRVKAEIERDGVSLLQRTLGARSWLHDQCASPTKFTFVLRDTKISRQFGEERLAEWYPNSRSIFLSGETRGAALSAVAGVAAMSDAAELLCIDLVDIEYVSDFDPERAFAERPDLGAVGLTFHSEKSIYSYLRTDETGEVVEAAEKRVISQNASAGTYFFASAAVYLTALAHNLKNADANTFNGLFYVCPIFNGVLANGLRVALEPVRDVRDEK